MPSWRSALHSSGLLCASQHQSAEGWSLAAMALLLLQQKKCYCSMSRSGVHWKGYIGKLKP